jgi:hypothetical protein
MNSREIHGYTDCPIDFLGDVPGQKAPIRKCQILAYDGDKYCCILVHGVITEVKSGYVYKEKGRCCEVESYLHDDLTGLPEYEVKL